MRKKIEKRNDYGKIALIAVVIFAVLIAVGGASAYVASTITINNSDGGIVNVDGDNIQQVDSDSDAFGASADYCVGDETTTNMCVVDIYNLTVAAGGLTVSGTTTLTGTTTPAIATKYTISDSLSLIATSTATGGTAAEPNNNHILAYYTNTGADKIVDWTGIDQLIANTAFAASYQCGTSTWVGGIEGVQMTATSSASIIASTTIATTWTTDLDGLIDVENDTSTSSGLAEDKTKFPLKNGDVLFCTWSPYGATSSASFTAAGGFGGVGKMFTNLFARDN